MPLHDWTRVDAGLYHVFHQNWTIEIFRALNRGVLPTGYVAIGVAVADAPPRARLVARAESEPAAYARKANRIIVRQGLGPVVAVIKVVSPGNKDSGHAVRAFKTKALEFLRSGVSVLRVDLFPPTPRDPDGLHPLVWDDFPGPPFEARPADKPLTIASLDPGDGPTAYVDPVAVGEPLPDAPLFLGPGRYVYAPLERTYVAAWDETPQLIRDLVQPPTN